jgi:acyl carrier protein
MGMSDSVKDRILEIIAEQAVLEPSDISLDQSLEESFDIQVPFNANEPEKSDFDISSVGAVVAAVEKLVADRAA